MGWESGSGLLAERAGVPEAAYGRLAHRGELQRQRRVELSARPFARSAKTQVWEAYSVLGAGVYGACSLWGNLSGNLSLNCRCHILLEKGLASWDACHWSCFSDAIQCHDVGAVNDWRSCPTVLRAVSPDLLRQTEKIRAYRRLLLRCAPTMGQTSALHTTQELFASPLESTCEKFLCLNLSALAGACSACRSASSFRRCERLAGS